MGWHSTCSLDGAADRRPSNRPQRKKATVVDVLKAALGLDPASKTDNKKWRKLRTLLRLVTHDVLDVHNTAFTDHAMAVQNLAIKRVMDSTPMYMFVHDLPTVSIKGNTMLARDDFENRPKLSKNRFPHRPGIKKWQP